MKIKLLKNKDKMFCVLFFAVLLLPKVTLAAQYHVSPSGSDSNDGLTENTAWKTFSKAFSSMVAGDELILLDGTYSEEAGTGYISYLGINSAQIPSGIDRDHMTYVHAKNYGQVVIEGTLFVGRSFRRDNYIKLEGIKFNGVSSSAGQVYNASYVMIRSCGFYADINDNGSVFGLGTNDITTPATSNILIEDVWIWGRARIIAINYKSDRNIWRRVVVRGDGCTGVGCVNSPNVGITVYDSTKTSLQNVLVVDRRLDLAGSSPYADFAVAQHTPGEAYGNNEWLGTISVKAPDGGYYFEPDASSLSPAQTVRNAVALLPENFGFNVSRTGDNHIENVTAYVSNSGGSGIRMAPELGQTSGYVRNAVAFGNGRWGINSSLQPSYSNVYGTWEESSYNQTVCAVGCLATNPLTNGSMEYITRIENESPLKGTGYGEADYGANIVYRYGTDGAFWGDSGYNNLTSNLLWPWPNEDRIKVDFASTGNGARGFAVSGNGLYGGLITLTSYIWEYLGNPCPADICNYATDMISPDAPAGLAVR
ncbi:MAG: EGF-like protein [Patescibacteria group bacterium]|nr:EGF-like protein [Patescibacteria group bacterium]